MEISILGLGSKAAKGGEIPFLPKKERRKWPKRAKLSESVLLRGMIYVMLSVPSWRQSDRHEGFPLSLQPPSVAQAHSSDMRLHVLCNATYSDKGRDGRMEL